MRSNCSLFKTRLSVRNEIAQYGSFVEIHIETSLEICEKRDRKGLYKLARQGKIEAFTGISDPYEIPEKPELRLNTENASVDYCAEKIILKLQTMGLIELDN